jgi:hypothetical protein
MPHRHYEVLALHCHRESVAEELVFGPELVDNADLVRSGAILSERGEW